MHPTVSYQIALQNQARILDTAAADRRARHATTAGPTLVARFWSTLRGTTDATTHPWAPRAEARTADTAPITGAGRI